MRVEIGKNGCKRKWVNEHDKKQYRKIFEICRKSKVHEYIQNGEEFFVVDMGKKRVYPSGDLRLRELSEKLDREDTFVIKEASYH